MLTHGAGVTAAIASIVLCTLLPFLPGDYDPLAAPLSLVAQPFGRVGWVLVPVGALWIGVEHLRPTSRTRTVFGRVAFGAVAALGAVLSFAASLESVTLGVVSLVAGGFLAFQLLARTRTLDGNAGRTYSPAPWYLVIVPVAVALIQAALARPVSELTRSRGIRNSARLIADIEDYRVRNGRYPLSLIAVNRDYSPSILGTRQYLYEPNGGAYNLLFEQSTFHLGTREFVIYNPRNEHAMTSHTIDRLQLTPEALRLDGTRGHNALHDAPYANWKYFWFD